MRFYRPPFPAEYIYPGAVFRLKGEGNVLCLTFDDGPDPASTPRLLEILERQSVSAVFFCNGIRAETFPEIVSSIRQHGHVVGNHGYRHLDGFRTSIPDYSANAGRADSCTSSTLFRPPYGRIRPAQYLSLRGKYKIVMWDLMPYDFDSRGGRERCLGILKSRIRPGSVIVLHDRADSLAQDITEEFILSAKERGYRFENPFNK